MTNEVEKNFAIQRQLQLKICDDVILRVRPTSGSGQLVCFGASANNASNDPAAHLAVQGQ